MAPKKKKPKVPTSTAKFKAEAARQGALIAASEAAKDDMAFVESLIDWDALPEWNPPVSKDIAKQ